MSFVSDIEDILGTSLGGAHMMNGKARPNAERGVRMVVEALLS